VTRLLTGVLNQHVEVQFIVVDEPIDIDDEPNDGEPVDQVSRNNDLWIEKWPV
jgi:hypothetical protein